MGIHTSRDTSVALNRYQKFAKVALELAAEADHDVTHQLCALVVLKNRVLSVGYNQPKTHTISADTKMQQLHAEMHAIIRCPDEDLRGAEIVVARCRPSGNPGLAKPCPVCEGILRRSGVRRVIYTVSCETPDDPEVKEMRL
jgi:tRNA(Arg) A34 adenosine deaminase TadA